MEAKVKAKELVGKMLLEHDMPYDLAQQCAIICCEEIIESHEKKYRGYGAIVDYYHEVKAEINLL